MSNTAGGVLKMTSKGGGVLRDPLFSFRRRPNDVAVPSRLIREYGLVEGAAVTGSIRKGPDGPELSSVDLVCGVTPDAFCGRRPFKILTAIDPCERFHLAASGETSMRIVDLVAPIGKGTRGLIVSPPKAGKTMLLEQIARAIHADDPGTRIIVLLIDERPEEVTNFQRSVEAEVLSSSSDQSMQEHVDLAELTLAHIRTDLECGRDEPQIDRHGLAKGEKVHAAFFDLVLHLIDLAVIVDRFLRGCAITMLDGLECLAHDRLHPSSHEEDLLVERPQLGIKMPLQILFSSARPDQLPNRPVYPNLPVM